MPRESLIQEQGWSLTELLIVLAIMRHHGCIGRAELSDIDRKGPGS